VVERFVDRKDKKDLIKKSDFKPRKHGISLLKIFLAFLIILFATTFLLGSLISDLYDLKTSEVAETASKVFSIFPSAGNTIAILGVVVLCAMAVGIAAVYFIYRIRETVMETEFQNMVFANCMRINSDFCLIINNEKKALYSDYNFIQAFASFGEDNTDSFDRLLASQGFSPEDEKSFKGAIQAGEPAVIPFVLKSDDSTKSMEVTIDPITRPEGFFLIKGQTKEAA